MVFQIFDTWRPQLLFFLNYRISVILQQQYNDFMTVVVLLAFSNALAQAYDDDQSGHYLTKSKVIISQD